MKIAACGLREHDASATSVEDHEVFHEDRLATRLASHRLPCLDDVALDIFRDREATQKTTLVSLHELGNFPMELTVA